MRWRRFQGRHAVLLGHLGELCRPIKGVALGSQRLFEGGVIGLRDMLDPLCGSLPS